MKLPFTFGAPLVFRLALPGILATIMLAPITAFLVQEADNKPPIEVVLPVLAVFIGWLISLADMRIYMLFEGRRWWNWLRLSFLAREQGRLSLLQSKAEAAKERGDKKQELEIAVEIANFPWDHEERARTATMPTRLGNLIEEYEQYPRIKYGMDAVFYWPRIWIALPKEIREEFDSKQSVVDGALYLSAILAAAGPLAAIYLLLQQIFSFHPQYIPPSWILAIMMPAFPFLGFLLYRISLPAHKQVGELFKAVFDQFQTKIRPQEAVLAIRERTGDDLSKLTPRGRHRAVHLYLRLHAYWPDGADTYMTMGDYRRIRKDQRATVPTKN